MKINIRCLNNKENNGFTLIELLAVIVILAIIMVIAVPKILDVIESSRRSAARSSIELVKDAIKTQVTTGSLSGTTFEKTGDCYEFNFADQESGNAKKLALKNKEKIGGSIKYCNGKFEEDTLSFDGEKTYTVYADGTAVYYNPVTGNKCNASEAVSTTGTKTGCMKFYTFNDEGKNADKVNMILDHNTTATVAWNSSGYSGYGMNELKTAIETDTANWKDKATARLITADEIAHIVGADKEDTIKWSSSKTYAYGEENIETSVDWFYLDGTGTTYSVSNGWQVEVTRPQGTSKYAWLFDNTNGCISYGCNIADSSNKGYWTSNPVVGNYGSAWSVAWDGSLYFYFADTYGYVGARPVITISKSSIS